MIKQIAWNTFKNTGDIHTMLELIEVEKAIKNTKLPKGTEPIDNVVGEKENLTGFNDGNYKN